MKLICSEDRTLKNSSITFSFSLFTTGSSKTDSPKTGVAGAGVAVAGLAIAVGTAFALRKKED